MTTIDIFNAHENFNDQALQIFYFQAEENKVYKDYLKHLGVNPNNIFEVEEIPFLPIEFFKNNKVVCDNLPIERVFKSSGTGNLRSTHYIVDTSIYIASFIKNFEIEYGALEEICILGLLPNYQENPDSSLLFMMNELIEMTAQNGSKYLSLEDVNLIDQLKKANQSNLKTILVGVSFALLDLVEKQSIDLSNLIIMETGGMKGRRKEITRTELHQALCEGFMVDKIHSEYGMCELLSQAYSAGDGVFKSPNWMKILTRPIQEPFSKMELNKAGVVKVIDLANIYSCSFIETQDIGLVKKDGTFEILGRLDNADLRGCNLMA